jgi:hypothetical protein
MCASSNPPLALVDFSLYSALRRYILLLIQQSTFTPSVPNLANNVLGLVILSTIVA